MYKFFKIILPVFLLFTAPAVYSQDYIVTSAGETVRGKITAFTSSSLKLKTENKRTVKYSPEQILKVSDDGITYLSRQVYHKNGDAWRILRLVDSGAVNLLTLDDGYSPSVSVSTGVLGGGVMGGLGGLGVSLGSGRGKSPAYYVEKSGERTILKDVVTRFMAGDSRKQEVTELLLTVMGDIPEVADKINNTSRFTEKTLRDLVYEYNDISGL